LLLTERQLGRGRLLTAWLIARLPSDLRTPEQTPFFGFRYSIFNFNSPGADALGQLSSVKLRLGCTHLLHVTLQTELKRVYMIVAKEKIKAIICLDEGDATKVHEAVALPVFGSSDSSHISGLILEPTKQQKGQYRRLGSFRLYKSKYCKAFEAASAERSCWVESHELFKIHHIINLV
jgi:hypothetical protein